MEGNIRFSALKVNFLKKDSGSLSPPLYSKVNQIVSTQVH